MTINSDYPHLEGTDGSSKTETPSPPYYPPYTADTFHVHCRSLVNVAINIWQCLRPKHFFFFRKKARSICTLGKITIHRNKNERTHTFSLCSGRTHFEKMFSFSSVVSHITTLSLPGRSPADFLLPLRPILHVLFENSTVVELPRFEFSTCPFLLPRTCVQPV